LSTYCCRVIVDLIMAACTKVIFNRTISNFGSLSLFEGFHKPTQQKILIKHYNYYKITDLAQGINELFCQAKLHHSHFCNIIDVLFTERETGYELILCLERLDKDLQREIEDRAYRGQMYGEQELWEFLQGTVEALALAQDLVNCT